MKVDCPGCGLETVAGTSCLDPRCNASCGCRSLYDDLSAFTLASGEADFIHQLVMDAYAAQHAGPNLKPITVAFALIGLYLVFERGFTGRQVQRTHLILGSLHTKWPRLEPTGVKAVMTVQDVTTGISPDNYRDRINDWGLAVWRTWQPLEPQVAELATGYLKI